MSEGQALHLSYYLPLIFACQAAALQGLLFKPLRTNLVLAVLLALLCALFLHNKGHDFYVSNAEVADSWHNQERYKTLASYLAALPPEKYFPVIDNDFTAQAVEWYLNQSTPARSLADFRVSPGQKQVDLLYFTQVKDATGNEMSRVFMRNDLPPSCLQGEVGKMDLYMRSIPRTGHIDWSPNSPLGSTNGFPPYALLSSIRSLDNIRIYAFKHFYLCPAKAKRSAEAVFRFASPKAFPAGTVYLLLSAQLHKPGNWLSLDASFDGEKEVNVLTRDTPSDDTVFWLRLDAKKPFTTLDVRLKMYVSGEYAENINGPLEQVRADNLLAFIPSDSNRFHSTGFNVAEQGLETPQPDGNGGLFRWGHDTSTLRFTLDRPQSMSLRYAADSTLPTKIGTVLVNNQVVGRIALHGGLTADRVDFTGKSGENVVEILWSDSTGGNHPPSDAKTVRFTSLYLEAAHTHTVKGKD